MIQCKCLLNINKCYKALSFLSPEMGGSADKVAL